jgi:hypothetical protein
VPRLGDLYQLPALQPLAAVYRDPGWERDGRGRLLFSRTGLDPTVKHTIDLAIKSQSPSATRPPTLPDDVFDFSLINFMCVALLCGVTGSGVADQEP